MSGRAGTRRRSDSGGAHGSARCPDGARQASSSSARRSARSGRRSGTSRRSTSRPPRPPVTSTANRRPRPPSRTVSWNCSSAMAAAPGGRLDDRQATRPQVQLAESGRAVEAERADAPAGSQAGRRDHRAERRQQVVGQVGQDRPPLGRVGDGAERREQPGVVERVLARARPAQDVDQGEHHGRAGCHRPDAAAGDDEIGRGPVEPVRRPVGQAAEGGARCGESQLDARRRRRRPTARCAARAIDRAGDGDRRPGSTRWPPDRRPHRRGRRAPGRPRARPPGPRPEPPLPIAGQAPTRVPPSKPISTMSTRRSRISARLQAAGPRARRESSGGQRQIEQHLAQGRARVAGSGRRGQDDRAPVAPRRRRRRRAGSAIPPARTTVISGRRSARRRQQRPQLAQGAALVGGRRIAGPGQDAVDRGDRGAWSTSPADRSSRAGREGPPAAPRGGGDERVQRAFGSGDRPPGGGPAGSRPRPAAGRPAARPSRPSDVRKGGIGRPDALEQDGRDGLGLGAGWQGERTDQAPPPADPPDERRRRSSRRPMSMGQEGRGSLVTGCYRSSPRRLRARGWAFASTSRALALASRARG